MKIDGAGEYGVYDSDYLDEEPMDEDSRAGNNRSRARARGYVPPYDEPTRRPSADREKAFNTLLWLIEGATGALEELRHSDFGLSEDFWVHASAARREGLLAMRAVLDQMIENAESQQAEQRERQQRRERRGGINVDF